MLKPMLQPTVNSLSHTLRMLVASAVIIVSSAAAMAQGQPPAPKQVPITDAQVQQMLAAKGDLDAIDAKYGNDKSEAADKKAMAEAEVAVQKAGFKGGLAEFDNVAFSVGVVLGALDENNTMMSKDQIVARTRKEIETSAMPDAEKKKALVEMEKSIGEIETPLAANIEIVKKQSAKLRQMLQ